MTRLIGRTESLVLAGGYRGARNRPPRMGRTNNQLMELLACVSQTS